MKKIYKPTETVPPFYQRYIQLVPDDGNLLIHLEDIYSETEELIGPLSEEKMNYRYAPGKWTIKDMLVHLSDSERIFIYRAFVFHVVMKLRYLVLRKVNMRVCRGK